MTSNTTVVLKPNSFGLPEITYNQEDFLANGVLGDVYHRKSNPNYVIKVPRGDANRLFQFGQEARLLTYLEQKQVNTPPIATDTDQTSIVMPFYKKEDRYYLKLRELLDKNAYDEAEKLTIDLMIAFCKAMIALHDYTDVVTNKKYTCTDRKVIDFYVLDKPNKIIILDWNVLSEYEAEFRNAEVQVFGTLIHESYFGTKGKFPYRPFQDDRWGTQKETMSVGLRYLLARMVLPTTYYTTPDATSYFVGLQKHLEVWKKVIESKIMPTDIASQLDIPSQDKIHVDAIIADMNWRWDKNSQTLEKTRTSILQQAHELGLSQSGRIRQEILDGLNLSADKSDKIIQNYDSGENHEPTLKMHIERWKTLIEYAKGADYLDLRTKAEIRAQLGTIGGILHTEEVQILSSDEIVKLNDALRRLQSLNPTDENLTDKLNVIRHELALHEQVHAFNHESRFDARADILHQIRKSPLPPYIPEPIWSQLFDTYYLDESQLDGEQDDEYRLFYAQIKTTALVRGQEAWVAKWLDPIENAFDLLAWYESILPAQISLADAHIIPQRLDQVILCLDALQGRVWYHYFEPKFKIFVQADLDRFVSLINTIIMPDHIIWNNLDTAYEAVFAMKVWIAKDIAYDFLHHDEMDNLIKLFMERLEINSNYRQSKITLAYDIENLSGLDITHSDYPELEDKISRLAGELNDYYKSHKALLDIRLHTPQPKPVKKVNVS